MTETIMITGANRGIGLEFARQYAIEGAHVFACCREPEHANELSALQKAHKNIQLYQLDVTSEKEIACDSYGCM